MFGCLDPTHKTLATDCLEGKTDHVTFYVVTLVKCLEIGQWPAVILCSGSQGLPQITREREPFQRWVPVKKWWRGFLANSHHSLKGNHSISNKQG